MHIPKITQTRPANKIHIPHPLQSVRHNSAHNKLKTNHVRQSTTKTPPHCTQHHALATSTIRHTLTSPRANNLATSQQHQPHRAGLNQHGPKPFTITCPLPSGGRLSHMNNIRNTLIIAQATAGPPQKTTNKTYTSDHTSHRPRYFVTHVVAQPHPASHHTFHMQPALGRVVT